MAAKAQRKVEEPIAEEPVKVEYPHAREIFDMTFATDEPGLYVGVRKGMALGTIEFYPKKVE